MRLYLKLIVMILSFALLQRYAMREANELWFVVRCQYVALVGDEAAQARLVEDTREVVLRELEERQLAFEASVFAAAAR